MTSRRSLIFISSSDYDALLAKGVTGMIAQRAEGGYFDRVISVHPLARKSRTIPIAVGHELVEFGFDALPFGARFRFLRLLYAPLYVFRAVIGIRRLILAEQIDIVRASDPYWAAPIGWLATLGTNAIFVISIHADWDLRHKLDPKSGAPKLFGSRFAAGLLATAMLTRAKRVLCIRPSLVPGVVRAGASEQKIRIFTHGIDLQPFRRPPPGHDPLLTSGRRMVFFAGRLSRENYIDDVFEVGRRLAKRGDVTVVMAGAGPEEKRLLDQLASEPALGLAIQMLGFLPRDRVLELRKMAAVNLAPMGGFSLIEACASGRPTVAYDVEWHSELIENRRSGFLVPEHSVDLLVAAINELLDDEALANSIGIAGRERAFALHDLTSVSRKRADLYEQMLEEFS